MAFDQIAVAGIHDAHSVGQIRGSQRMQKLTEYGYGCRQICNHIGDIG